VKPYEDNHIRIFNKDCSDMGELSDESIDLIVTDPPYGISFMGKDWDKALPDRRIWVECLRVLKPGAFAFVMSIPRADCLSRMVISLEDAGFLVNFTPIFWAYASGFPKAQHIGKAVDKKLGAEREVVGKRVSAYGTQPVGNEVKSRGDGKGGAGLWRGGEPKEVMLVGQASSLQAKALDGSYGGFQPKPAVEVIIVCMKPLSEKTFVDQALKNGKGITWLDDGRIPHEGKDTGRPPRFSPIHNGGQKPIQTFSNQSGRFPANLLVSDDVLNDGRISKSRGNKQTKVHQFKNADNYLYGDYGPIYHERGGSGDSGSFSRYFDLDKWWAERIKQLPKSAQRTFPFLIVPKASKSEKNRGIGGAVPRTKHGSTPRKNEAENKSPNYHPTVKPVKLMSYLITLGSREGDTVVDNFGGSGTTAVAARLLGRKCVMYEIAERYCEIAVHRLRQMVLDEIKKLELMKG